MKREKWLKWEPSEGIPPTFWLMDFKYSEGLLTLYVQDQINKSLPMLSICFSDFLSMHITDEGNLLKDTCDIDESLMKMEKKPGYYYRWSLFIVENSHYIEWFNKEILGKGENLDIIHYVIKTPNEIVEVLDSTDHKPILRWN